MLNEDERAARVRPPAGKPGQAAAEVIEALVRLRLTRAAASFEDSYLQVDQN